ncbi:MAG: hypothetical protein NZ853_10110 [Leptospiraceae bacterium]|nr:hypothetical protein [Leptospiraceae bacterium]MDW7974990.1 hypothetical protein [Leptospiraceae bacterium]
MNLKTFFFLVLGLLLSKVSFSQTITKAPAKSLTAPTKIEKPQQLLKENQKFKLIIENIDSTKWIQGEEQQENVIRIFGRVKVILQTGFFYADEVIIDTQRKELFAYGNIEYHEENAYVKVEKIIYDYEHHYGILYNGNGYKDPVYFVGLFVRGLGENRFEISDAFFTSCMQEKPHTHFTARKIYLLENNEIIALGVWYYVGGVPLIPLPFYYSNPWGTGIITQLGYSNVSGYFLHNTYQFSIPRLYLSNFLPLAYRIKLDYYEKRGLFFGTEFYRFSPTLSYILDLGYAEYKRYEFQLDVREKDYLRVTNRIQQKDGTFAEEKYKWTKVFSILTFNQQNPEKNRVQKLTLRILNYSHRLFEYEFGGRFLPTTTLPALYTVAEPNRGIIQNQTEYALYYNDKIDDLTVNFQASRVKIWRESSNFPDSKFIPANDVIPNLEIQKNVFLGYWLSLPFYWNNVFQHTTSKVYTDGKPYYTNYFNKLETSFRTTISFYPYFSYSPTVGYGGQKYSPYKENISEDAYRSLQIYSRKQSYEYYYTNQILTLGPSSFFLELNHTRKLSLREELRDRGVITQGEYNDREKINETLVRWSMNPWEFFSLSIESIYNHKKFEYPIRNEERWTYPVAKAEIFINFLNPFKPSQFHLLSKKRIVVSELKISNDYVYDHLRKKDHSNLLGISYYISNFDLFFLRRLRYFEAGFYWYHVYQQPALDQMRFLSRLDLQITKQIFFEMELESRLTKPTKYIQRTQECRFVDGQIKCIPAKWIPESEKSRTFWQDILESTGLYEKEKRQNAAFNIGYFQGTLIFDLHDWEFRLGYELQQKSILAGVNSVSVVHFYDNIVFFSFNFVKFDVGGLAQRPSRFIVDRRKVNPFDIAKTSFYTR